MKKIALFLFGITLFFACKKDTDGLFFADVKTIVSNNCLSCHNSTLPVLSSDAALVSQAAKIKSVVADPVTATNPRMPQGGSLTAAQIATITDWFAAGGTAND